MQPLKQLVFLLALSGSLACNTTPSTIPGGAGNAQFLDGQWVSLFDDGHKDCLTFQDSMLVDVKTGCTGPNTLTSAQAASVVGDLLTFTISGMAQDGSITQTTASLRIINNDLLTGSILRLKADGTQATLAVTLTRA